MEVESESKMRQRKRWNKTGGESERRVIERERERINQEAQQ